MSRVVDAVRDAIEACLDVSGGDTIMVFTDSQTMRVADTIARAARSLSIQTRIADLDRYERPLNRLPQHIKQYMEKERPAYTFYAASVKPGEQPFRGELVRHAISLGAGHVHMPKVTMEILGRVEGCRRTAAIIERLYNILSQTRTISVTTSQGTRLQVRVGRYRWRANTGIIRRGEWDNWPPGEVFTTPETVDGVLIVDGVLGDYFSVKYGLLRKPVTVEFQEGRAASISGGPVADELYRYVSRHECGLTAGEIGIGGNPWITKPIGNMLHDEKMPGAHIALGDPLGSSTGAEWSCPVHVDMLPLNATVRADTVTIVREGKLSII